MSIYCVRTQSNCARKQLFFHLICQLYKFRDRKLLWAACHHLVLEEIWGGRMVAIKDLSQGDAQHLTALIEHGLHHALEQLFVASKVSHLVARHTNDGTLYLGRRIKDARLYREEIFDMIPRLNQYGENAILLVAWLRGHAYSHLVLDHACTAGYQILIIKHLEENLRGDIIGIVARQHKLLSIEHLLEIHAEEIATYYIII